MPAVSLPAPLWHQCLAVMFSEIPGMSAVSVEFWAFIGRVKEIWGLAEVMQQRAGNGHTVRIGWQLTRPVVYGAVCACGWETMPFFDPVLFATTVWGHIAGEDLFDAVFDAAELIPCE